jgi:hypothetical protein
VLSRPSAERLARTAAMGSCRTFGGARPSSSIGNAPPAPHRGAPLSPEDGKRTHRVGVASPMRVELLPLVDDPSIRQMVDVDRDSCDAPARGWNAEERAVLSALGRPMRHDHPSFRDLVINREPEVRQCREGHPRVWSSSLDGARPPTIYSEPVVWP